MHQLLLAATLAVGANGMSPASRFSGDSIRRLAPSMFPQVPASVRHDLETRGCLVPQTWLGRAPQNAIRGAFTTANAIEWAILCSVRDTSQILIYRLRRSSTSRVVDSLERSGDGAWLQDIGAGRTGYSRLIHALPRQRISGWRADVDRHRIPQPIDHDAIEQSFIEKASQAFYFARCRWYRQVTAD